MHKRRPLPPFLPRKGRPTVAIQVGNPAPDAETGITFERNRIKRTPQMLPKTALSESRWDLLYSTGAASPKVAFFDWDADNIYLAWESPIPEPIRFDLDGTDNGFLRGADNLRIFVDTPSTIDPDATSVTIPVTAELWDSTQNGDHPVKRDAPIPLTAVKAVAARTVRGTYVVMVSVGRTELAGLPRTAGQRIGLRIETGAQPVSADGSVSVSSKPFLHLVLADHIDAQDSGVQISLKIVSAKALVSGDPLRAV